MVVDFTSGLELKSVFQGKGLLLLYFKLHVNSTVRFKSSDFKQTVEMKWFLSFSSLELFFILYFPFCKSLSLQFSAISLCLSALSP